MKVLFKLMSVLSVTLLMFVGCAKQGKQPFETEKWEYEFKMEYPGPFYSAGDKLKIEHFSETKENYLIKTIEGEVTDIDEDSFSTGYIGFFSAAGTNFRLEFIRVRDTYTNKERKFLIPQPFNLKVGDYTKEDYLLLGKDISFKQITDRWDRMFSATQIGRFDNIEGVIVKDTGFCEDYLQKVEPEGWGKLEREGEIFNQGPNLKYTLLKKYKIN